MFRNIALVVVIWVVGLLLFAANGADSFLVVRSATIAAPPDKVFAYINDFHRWEAWSPWEKKDPDMKRSFGAVTAGRGATYAWQGDSNVGAGSMRIAESVPPEGIMIDLDFTRPFEAHNVVDFTLEDAGGSTKVTWAMHGPNNFLSKLISVFVSMDSMVGKDFEDGLASLKAAAESRPPGG